ncbi:MAG: YHS domain-containing protein [Nitrospirota bacterium]
MAKDPVCNMEVNEAETLHTSSYEGQPYYFCSATCKQEFNMNPERYATKAAAAGYGTAMKEKAGHTSQKVRESHAYQKLMERSDQFRSKTKDQARSMVSEKKAKTADVLTSVVQALRQTAQQLQGQQQASVARYADKAAEKVESLSNYLKNKDVDNLLDDAESFIHRQPALFLGSAFAAGFVLSRFLKSSGRGTRYASTTEGYQ